jgi:hypothetical protein
LCFADALAVKRQKQRDYMKHMKERFPLKYEERLRRDRERKRRNKRIEEDNMRVEEAA